MRKLRNGLVVGVSVLWAGAVWAGPPTWQTASLNSGTKLSDLNGTYSDIELAKKKAKKKHSDDPSGGGTIEPGKTKMLDLKGTDSDTELAKKKAKKKYSEDA